MELDRGIRRRAFLELIARAGLGTAALAALPPFVRRGLGAPQATELIVRNEWPEHLETTLEALGRSWITRNDRFFVRSHFPPPEVDVATWRLEVAGLVKTPLSLTLDEVKALPQTEAVVTLECAGNGRGFYDLPSTSGTQWEHGAVGNASWSGTKLSLLLLRAGALPEAKHVWFEAADQAPLPDVPRFVRSIPIEKAMSDTLLAHAMNGEALSVAHGAPLRVVVPGWFGMASTKWLARVRLEATPSDNHFMAKGYRYTYPGEDPASAPPVEEIRVKSVITRPLDRARVPLGKVRIQGFAWAGPSGIALVEVSTDGGKSWRPAGFMGDRAPGAWRAWATEVEVKTPATLRIMARAKDGAGNVQPLAARANAGGYGNNSIRTVTVHVRA